MIKPDLAIDLPTICCYREIEFDYYPPEVWQQNVPEMPKFSRKGVPPQSPQYKLESFLSAVIIVKGYWKFFLDPDWGKLQGPPHGIGPGIYPRITDNLGFPDNAMASLQIAEPTAMTPVPQILVFSLPDIRGPYDVFTNSFGKTKFGSVASMIIFKGSWELFHDYDFGGKGSVVAGPGVYFRHGGHGFYDFTAEGGLRSAKLVGM